MAVIPLRVHRMKKKLEKMQLKERLIYGYGRVILRMIVSGVLSLIVIGLLMGNMLRYVENVERADVAVKICRIDVNSAARNIREMALNSDTSTYDSYQQQVETQLAEVDSELKADIVLADVPCSGYGVIGKKPEIKYRVTPQKQEEIVILQRTILDCAAEYVKPGGVLVFSTCTIAKEENEENMLWFMNNHPFKLESIDPYLPEELHSETTALGYLQLLPGVHKTDGFFIAKFRRK